MVTIQLTVNKYHHIHSIIIPLVSGPFQGSTPVTGPRSLPRGVPHDGISLGYVVPPPGLDGLPSWPRLDGVPSPPPSPGWVLFGKLHAWTDYAVGSMPRAVSRRTTFLFRNEIKGGVDMEFGNFLLICFPRKGFLLRSCFLHKSTINYRNKC